MCGRFKKYQQTKKTTYIAAVISGRFIVTIAVRNKKVGTSAAYLKTETLGIDEKIMRGSLCNIA